MRGEQINDTPAPGDNEGKRWYTPLRERGAWPSQPAAPMVPVLVDGEFVETVKRTPRFVTVRMGDDSVRHLRWWEYERACAEGLVEASAVVAYIAGQRRQHGAVRRAPVDTPG